MLKQSSKNKAAWNIYTQAGLKAGSHLNCTHLEDYYDEVGVEGVLEGSVVKGAEERSSSRGMGV